MGKPLVASALTERLLGGDSIQLFGHGSFRITLVLALVFSLIGLGRALAQAPMSPVRSEHLQQIREQFRAHGLRQAAVGLDTRGRLELQGAYENESEVDRAFSLANVSGIVM